MNIYEALERGATAGLVRDDLASGGREPLTAQWGKVNDEGYVVLDDGAVLTEEIPALASLSPGQTVILHRSGQGLWIAGALSRPVTLTPGVGLDEMTMPGQYVLEDPALALPEFSYPEQSSGWLSVFGNGSRVLQNFTAEQSNRTYTRTYSNGTWSAWVSDTQQKGAISLNSPWRQYGDVSTWGPAYCSTQGTHAMLSGMVTGGLGGMDQPIGQVPEFARPPRHRIVTTQVDSSSAGLQIAPNGDIHLRGARESLTWVSLSVSYRL